MNEDLSLKDLKQGETAVVRDLSCPGTIHRRLQDLGLIRGTGVECVGVSPLGDPAAYLIRGAVIALRGSDAASVRVEVPAPSADEKSAVSACPPGGAAE